MDSFIKKKYNAKFYIKFRMVNKLFRELLDNRKNKSVSGLANIWNVFQKFKLKKILLCFMGPLFLVWNTLKNEMDKSENVFVGGEEMKCPVLHKVPYGEQSIPIK